MKFSLKFSILFISLFIIYKETNALFRTESLFKPSARERFYDEQYSVYFKDNSKYRLSQNQRALIVTLVSSAVRRLNSYHSNIVQSINASSSAMSSPLQLMREIGHQFNLTTQTVGGLALLSLFAYGTFASLAPNLKNEISKSLSKEDKEGLQKLITDCMVGISDSLIKFVETSINGLPSFPHLDAQTCMSRMICEANYQPKKYGLIGIGLQLFFPPYVGNEKSLNKIHSVSKYQLAARFGKEASTNSTTDKPCSLQYDDCIFNFLDLLKLVF